MDPGVGAAADDDAFARAAASVKRVEQSASAAEAETKSHKTFAEQRQAIEARRQERRLAVAAADTERRKRLKLVGAENMSRWLSAGARGTAECRDPRGAPMRKREHGVVAATDSGSGTYRGEKGLGESSVVTPTVYGLANVLGGEGELHAASSRPTLKRYSRQARGAASSRSGAGGLAAMEFGAGASSSSKGVDSSDAAPARVPVA